MRLCSALDHSYFFSSCLSPRKLKDGLFVSEFSESFTRTSSRSLPIRQAS